MKTHFFCQRSECASTLNPQASFLPVVSIITLNHLKSGCREGTLNNQAQHPFCSALISWTWRRFCTVIGARMSYRKWRENKQHLIWWPELVLLGCCLVSLYFRCDILAPIPVRSCRCCCCRRGRSPPSCRWWRPCPWRGPPTAMLELMFETAHLMLPLMMLAAMTIQPPSAANMESTATGLWLSNSEGVVFAISIILLRGGSIPQNQESWIAIPSAWSWNEELEIRKWFLFDSFYDSFASNSFKM